MFERTQIFRPELEEASSEAEKSPDTHWTSQLSSSGMTRIARSVVLGLTVEDEDPTAGHLVEASWDTWAARGDRYHEFSDTM